MYLRTGLWLRASAWRRRSPRFPRGRRRPKRGGTLTYMIPADAPPSFDGHRETTFATVHAGGAVLQRADPGQSGQPGLDDRFRLRSVHRDAEADRRRQDLHLQDPRRRQVPRRLAADRRTTSAASWQQDRHSRRRASPARASELLRHGRQDRGARPDDRRLPAEIRRRRAFLPALADPFAFIYKKEILDKDPHWYEKNIMGSGPFKFAGYETGQSIKGVRNPDYYHKGLPYLDGFVGIFADKQAVRVEAIRADRAAIEFRGLPPSARDELVKELGDKITVQEQRLELRQPDHAQPQEEAVRRRAGAPRADAGDRPLGRRAGAVEDRHRADGRRHRLPGLAAGGDQGGAAADRRLLARHREVAGRGASGC